MNYIKKKLINSVKNLRYNTFMKKIIFMVILQLTLLFTACSTSKEDLKNGDIIFHDSTSSQSKAIKLATKSDYSHVGIIYREGEETYVYEASRTVRLTPLDQWINRGAGGHFVVKRLKDTTPLTKKGLEAMKEVGEKFINHPYDVLFSWSDKKIYCSELVWKIYKRALNIELGSLQKLKSFDLTHTIVKEKLHERYGDKIPFEEDVISPQSIFDSELLETVLKL